MTNREGIRYARSSGVSLAYECFGQGPVDIVVIPPTAQNIDLVWERPEFTDMFERLDSFARVLQFDKRGTGASDRTAAIPTLDERVDDTRAVMDAAGIERAVLYGVSEGGPMAMLFAVTYPERVSALVLHGTAATFVPPDDGDEARRARLKFHARFVSAWGTDDSITLRLLAPSAAADPSYLAWQPRYERQSATPAAVAELLTMIDDIDVSAVLPRISVRTLVVHRTGDPIIPIERARSVAAAIPGARLAEFEGSDHFAHVGDTGGWLAAVEEFVSGTPPRPSAPSRVALPASPTRIRTLGGFAVIRDGKKASIADWGSRRARQLCKRLAAEAGAPVPREQLIALLWPNSNVGYSRLGARLSVQLSTVRRILGGGVIADRDSIRLDIESVQLDLVDFYTAAARDDLSAAARCYRGPFLPEDPYEDWATTVRDQARVRFASTSQRLVRAAVEAGRYHDAFDSALAWLGSDPFDEPAHHAVIATLQALNRPLDVARAYATYIDRMNELGVLATPLDTIVLAPPR